jgi:hypothetical protein
LEILLFLQKLWVNKLALGLGLELERSKIAHHLPLKYTECKDTGIKGVNQFS